MSTVTARIRKLFALALLLGAAACAQVGGSAHYDYDANYSVADERPLYAY